jgi:chaperone required for assembly of F1-ATPase
MRAGACRSPQQAGYNLVLTKNPLKTPASNVLVLPTYALALAVAAEWEWLVSLCVGSGLAPARRPPATSLRRVLDTRTSTGPL